MRHTISLLVATVLALPVAAAAHTAPHAVLLLSQREALRLAFPDAAAAERRTAYLDDGQLARVAELAGIKVGSRVWTYYVGATADGRRGFAYFDVQQAGRAPETFMALLDESGELLRAELLRGLEPDRRRARGAWLASEGVRRIQALHAVLLGSPLP